ncbi:MAG TPA: glycoside hydrolase family 2 protein, partial [Gemmatimonadaceae bacterium]
IVASLVDHHTQSVLAEAFHFPLGLGAPRPMTNLSVRTTRIDDSSYSVTVQADQLALSVVIEAEGWRISSNYFHVAPQSEHVVILTALKETRGRPGGRVTALNCATSSPLHAE